ncbi:hypothetical protein BEWA_018320 [Theileria equi strain WA]|uniref:Hpc2-related domain-containing protein n=1 Tax=Theileria equi strain WA TaxID=1537102 RepID=L0AVS6_THEEQ|nr:hypothetical protein BEWA_018320 [Theileria equi strain WA]AFZ78989.1 hypothetical protein BEWA_018320 [Theileria equi strain WA]|eukprot:XP_004828655.1 hypothetical protein BEWA_018320 [Theileria equi strain WA]
MADHDPENKLNNSFVKIQNIVSNKNTNNSSTATVHSISVKKDDNSIDTKPKDHLSKTEEELIEQDLTDEDDTYEEPSIEKYLPGIYVDVKLKTKYIEHIGRKVVVPTIIDFYSECLKKYGDESNFIYEESYLEDMKIKDDGFRSENRNKSKKYPIDNNTCGIDDNNNINYAIQSQTTYEYGTQNRGDISYVESQRGLQHEDNIDDVVWLENRPNDPLLRCIRSITDRLNIQGIVGDPSSYLKEGGDDMHYDINDPFIDDSAMLSELNMSRNDILLKRDMEREFSDWSEEDEDIDIQEIKPSDFIANCYDAFKMEIAKNSIKENECTLFFNPGGWRKYMSRIPKQFLTIYYEFENANKNIADHLTDKVIRTKLKIFLESIFKKLVKVQEPKPKSKLVNSNGKNEDETISKKQKIKNDEFKIFGLNCILPWRIIGVNGRILRWIVRSIISITNAMSPYDLHKEWLTQVILHNEHMICEQTEKLRSKLTTKLQAIEKKNILVDSFTESIKSLSKNIGNIRKILKEYKDHANASKSVQMKQDKKDGNTKAKGNTETTKGSNTGSCLEDKRDIQHETEISSTYNENIKLVSKNDSNAEPLCDISTQNNVFCSDKEDDSLGNDDSLQTIEGKETNTGSQNTTNLKESTLNKDTDKTSESNMGDYGIAYFLKRSKIWKRIKGVHSIYRLVGNEMLVFIQMVNISLSVISTIGDTDFGYIVEENTLQQPLFDQSYKRLSDIVAKIVNETNSTKVNIPLDVTKVVVIHLQQVLKVKDLFERKNKRPLLFIDNSKLQAAPGRALIIGSKDKFKRTTSKEKTNGKNNITDKNHERTKREMQNKDDPNIQTNLGNNSQHTHFPGKFLKIKCIIVLYRKK